MSYSTIKCFKYVLCLYVVATRGKGISINFNRNQNCKLYKLDFKSNFIVNYAYEPE